MGMENSPDKLPSLDDLQRRIDEARPQGQEERDTPATSGMNQAMRMGVEMVSGVAVGSVFGFYVDRWLGTMPIFFIICFFLGAAAGFRNLIRGSAESDKE